MLTITFTEAFDFTITAPAGTGPDDFTADVDSSTPGTVVVTLGGSAPIVAGLEWLLTVNDATFVYEAQDFADATQIAAVDVAITDRDHKGVLVTETGGSTDVIEQATRVLLGNGLTGEQTGTTWVVEITTTQEVTTIDPLVFLTVKRNAADEQIGVEVAFLEPTTGFSSHTYEIEVGNRGQGGQREHRSSHRKLVGHLDRWDGDCRRR